MPVAKPQDHLPAKTADFTFKVNGKTYRLPSADQARAKMSGRDLRDAAVGGDVGQMAFLFKTVEASGADPKAIEALYDMPADETMDVLSDWADFDGVSLGESQA